VTAATNDPVRIGAYVVSETFIPGASNLLKGDFKDGALFAVAGWLAKRTFGVPGLVLVAAGSVAKATTGVNPLTALLNGITGESTAAPKAPVVKATVTTK
jgi:hypothetical protein